MVLLWEDSFRLLTMDGNTVCEEMLRGHEVSHLGHVHLHLSSTEGADGGLTL